MAASMSTKPYLGLNNLDLDYPSLVLYALHARITIQTPLKDSEDSEGIVHQEFTLTLRPGGFEFWHQGLESRARVLEPIGHRV